MMPFFASRHTSQASNASVQRRKGQSFVRNTTSNKRERERREEKRREERERDTHKEDKNREAHSASFHVFFFGETKELETKREKQRERERERERELERKPTRPKRASEYSSSVEEDLHAERRHFWIKLFPLVLVF